MTTIDPNEIDNLLLRELCNLNVRDRESINEEVHGVRCLAPLETVDMTNTSLAQLSKELALIRAKPAFDRSQELGNAVSATATPEKPTGTYVNSEAFRLRFLRCELFDAKKAAARLVSFLDVMMDVFDGKEELLVRPMRITDLGNRALAILETGDFQLLPYRDRSGRRIMTMVPNLGLAHNFRVTARIILYIFYVASESVESQRRGIAQIVYPSSISASLLTSLPGEEDRKLAARFNRSVPIRVVAMHICFPDTFFWRSFRAMILLSKQEEKFRVKTHPGSWADWQYNLMGYGIPIDQLPMTATGVVKTMGLQQWIRCRKSLELGNFGSDNRNDAIDDTAHPIECPNLYDVIFRPGKSYMCHPGNVVFFNLIESKMDEHFSVTRIEKAAIAWGIIHEVERRGGRFLKWDNRGWWTVCEDLSEIRYKIPTCFRDLRRKLIARKKRMTLMNENQHPTA